VNCDTSAGRLETPLGALNVNRRVMTSARKDEFAAITYTLVRLWQYFTGRNDIRI
jgi:hypothetical protein